MASQELEGMLQQHLTTVKTSKARNRLPATVIGAEYNQTREVGSSGAPPNPIETSLREKLETIGVIGEKGFDNIIGCCSEVHTSNKVLLRQIAPLNQIQFTLAIRPRNNQIIPTCENCKTVFS